MRCWLFRSPVVALVAVAVRAANNICPSSVLVFASLLKIKLPMRGGGGASRRRRRRRGVFELEEYCSAAATASHAAAHENKLARITAWIVERTDGWMTIV